MIPAPPINAPIRPSQFCVLPVSQITTAHGSTPVLHPRVYLPACTREGTRTEPDGQENTQPENTPKTEPERRPFPFHFTYVRPCRPIRRTSTVSRARSVRREEERTLAVFHLHVRPRETARERGGGSPHGLRTPPLGHRGTEETRAQLTVPFPLGGAAEKSDFCAHRSQPTHSACPLFPCGRGTTAPGQSAPPISVGLYRPASAESRAPAPRDSARTPGADVGCASVGGTAPRPPGATCHIATPAGSGLAAGGCACDCASGTWLDGNTAQCRKRARSLRDGRMKPALRNHRCRQVATKWCVCVCHESWRVCSTEPTCW